MATKQKQINKKQTTKKTPLLTKNRFNLPTLLALVAVLSVVGYYVLTTFASSWQRVSTCTTAPTPADQAAQDCYLKSVEGWTTKLYTVILNRAPDPSGYTYWSNKVASIGVGSSAIAMLGTSEAKTKFGNLAASAKTTTMYTRGVNRAPTATEAEYWTGRFNKESAGTVVTAFLASPNVLANSYIRRKTLDFMKPGWDPGTPTTCTECGCPGKPACPENPPEPPVDNPPTTDPGPDYNIVIPEGDSTSVDSGTDALPSLGEVSLDDLSNASTEDINKIIEEKTTSSSGGNDSEAAARSYGGKLKILPPEEAVTAGANEMRYYINGKLKSTVKKSPYAYTLDSTRVKNGRYALTIASYQNGEKLDEYSYVLSIKNSLTFWQKIYNLISSPFAK